MVDPRFRNVLRRIITGLKDSKVNWTIAESLGLALRGAFETVLGWGQSGTGPVSQDMASLNYLRHLSPSETW